MQLYHSGRMSLPDLLAKFTVNPARLLRLPNKGHLGTGADGDVTVFDPGAEWVFDVMATASKSRNSPFAGWMMKGRSVATFIGGREVTV